MTNESLPPPLPATPPPPSLQRGRRIGIIAAAFGGFVFLCLLALVVLRVSGLIGVYKIQNPAMSPAIKSGDNIFMEGITYHFHPPRRGDIVIFNGEKLPRAKPGERYVKRLVGLPGDHLRISEGSLYVNDERAAFRNKEGEIHYTTGLGPYLGREEETFTVPDGNYFVLGDNSRSSADSRMWGTVPAGWVTGRAVFCYLPSGNAGWLR